jgi:hypothetical protein
MTFWIILALLGAAFWLGLRLHHLFEGEWLPHDLWREFRLSRRKLSELDARWAQDTDRSDLVVTLTTTPSRIGLLEPVLKSLLDQTRPPARIILNVPDFSIRENVAYAIPESLSQLKSLDIRRTADLGPGTKLIPTLATLPASAGIVVLDDDRIYPGWLLEHYEAAARAHADRALTMAGWVVPENLTDEATTLRTSWSMLPPAPIRAPRLTSPREVDVMLGVFSYLVRPGFFDLAEMQAVDDGPAALRYVDDVRTSALCRARKFVIPAPSLSFVPWAQKAALQSTRLGLMNRGQGGTGNRHNTIAIRHFAGRWRVGGPRR